MPSIRPRARTRATFPWTLRLLALLGALTACGAPTSAPAPTDASGTSGASGASAPNGADATASGGASAAPAAASAVPLPAAAQEGAQAALTAYETARDDLANDRTEGLAKAAKEIGAAAKKASQAGPENLKPSFDRLVAAAAKLETGAAGKIEESRAAFGETSEAMVALLSAEPGLAQGRYVFECPMTDTYKKWVQVDDQIKNPYMGSRMLGCGMASTWEP